MRRNCASRLPRSRAGSPCAHLSKSSATMVPLRHNRFEGPKSPCRNACLGGSGGTPRSRASAARRHAVRSGERRGGEEGRTPGAAGHLKKKKLIHGLHFPQGTSTLYINPSELFQQ